MQNPIYFQSTNAYMPNGFAKKVNFTEALRQGLAPDAGLYMPTALPHFSKTDLEQLSGKSYPEVAFEVLYPFIASQFSVDIFRKMLAEAYNFPIPIETWQEKRYLARLDRGATASFKDFAARMMAQWMRYLYADEKLTILVATSGDTGGAVGAAFKGFDNIKVVILFPEQEVSAVQRKQLEGIGGNVQAVVIDGKFDDCQRLVKEAFADKELASLQLTSANSINIGRVLPQSVYYVYLYLQLISKGKIGEPINVVIPSGNLGNSLGAELARRMGVPFHKIIIATNANDAFPKFMQTSDYQPVIPSKACLSNAMNVGNPSNLARYFNLYQGVIDKDGKVHRSPEVQKMQEHLVGYSISDEETIETMQQYFTQHQCLLEPHGAVGVAALEKFLAENPQENETIALCIETAHPAKFPEIVQKVLGITPEPTEALASLLDHTGNSVPLPNDYQAFKHYLKTQV